MIIINESTRELGGSDLVCDCGQKVNFVMHWDFIEGTCACGKNYAIKIRGNMWNCCSGPETNNLYAPDGREGITAAQKMDIRVDQSNPSYCDKDCIHLSKGNQCRLFQISLNDNDSKIVRCSQCCIQRG